MVLFFKKRAFDFKEPITPFIWLTAVATLYEFIGTVLLKINTTYWSQLYSLLEFLALFYFFFKLFKPSYKNLFRIFLILLLIAYCTSFFFWTDKNSFITRAINKVPVTLFVLTFSFFWVRQLFHKMRISDPLQNPGFYFVSGFSVYYSSTIFLFLLSRFIFDSSLYFNDYWLINIMATLILRTSLIIGVWKMKQD